MREHIGVITVVIGVLAFICFGVLYGNGAFYGGNCDIHFTKDYAACMDPTGQVTKATFGLMASFAITFAGLWLQLKKVPGEA